MKPDNIIPLPRLETTKDEASLWLSQMDRGLSEDELTALQQWLDASEHNRTVLFQMAALWDDLSILNQLSSLFPFDPRTLREHTVDSPSKRPALAWGMAAAVLLSIVLLNPFQWGLGQASQQLATYETQVGQDSVITLSDGSSVHLNTNTQIEVSFSEQARHIDLKRGEAEFHVAHDESRPFIVKAQNSYIRAVGTIFNIQLGLNEVEVLVTEGKILVSENQLAALPIRLTGIEEKLGEDTVLVKSGQKATILKDQIKPVKSIKLQEVQQDLAWQQGMLVFRGESLTEALAEVSRYSDTRFSINDPKIAELKIAGYYKAGDVDGLLASLAENFDLNYTREPNNQVLIHSSK